LLVRISEDRRTALRKSTDCIRFIPTGARTVQELVRRAGATYAKSNGVRTGS
jgi:hypothetical protein